MPAVPHPRVEAFLPRDPGAPVRGCRGQEVLRDLQVCGLVTNRRSGARHRAVGDQSRGSWPAEVSAPSGSAGGRGCRVVCLRTRRSPRHSRSGHDPNGPAPSCDTWCPWCARGHATDATSDHRAASSGRWSHRRPTVGAAHPGGGWTTFRRRHRWIAHRRPAPPWTAVTCPPDDAGKRWVAHRRAELRSSRDAPDTAQRSARQVPLAGRQVGPRADVGDPAVDQDDDPVRLRQRRPLGGRHRRRSLPARAGAVHSSISVAASARTRRRRRATAPRRTRGRRPARTAAPGLRQPDPRWPTRRQGHPPTPRRDRAGPSSAPARRSVRGGRAGRCRRTCPRARAAPGRRGDPAGSQEGLRVVGHPAVPPHLAGARHRAGERRSRLDLPDPT